MAVLSEPVKSRPADPGRSVVDQRLALVERVASSAAFSKSVRLRDFLRYVGQRAAKTDTAEVHEQEIGEKVFGRRTDYDRSQDNIVRVNASELRRRVDAYFAAEGAQEPLVFSIPRGSYMPIFRLRSAAAQTAEPEVEPAVLAAEQPPARESHGTANVVANVWHGWPLRVLSTLLVVMATVCGILLWQNAHLRAYAPLREKQPTVDAFWANMINGQRDLDIVLSDDSISMVEEMTGKRIPLGSYTDRNFLGHLEMSKLSPDRAADVQLALSHNLVTLGGIYAAMRIRDLQPLSTSMHLAWARFYSADSMKQHNVVLIGGAKANPWVDLYEDQLNFKFSFDGGPEGFSIQNRHPQPGEASAYRDDAYSVVAYLPNPSNTGNVVLLQGSDSDASDAAAEFLTSEKSLNKLLETLHRKSFPHFELLLQVSRVRGTSLAAKIVAYRIYP